MSPRRLVPAALVALACGAAAPPAGAATGDIAITDMGPWLGQSGRVLEVGAGESAAKLLTAGQPLRNPWAVAVAGDGALLVVDEGADAVFSVASTGAISTVAGGAGLEDPVGITLAPDGKAYISDRSRDAVMRLDVETGALTVVAALEDPAGLAMDTAGKLLVADGRAVRRVDPGTGAVTTAAAGEPLDEPTDVAIAQDGTLYVAGDRQVVRVTPAGGKTVLAAGVPFDEPRAIDIAPDGDLLVVDRGASGGALIHVDRATGAETVVASGGPFIRPTGLAVVGGAGVDASGGGNGVPPEAPGGPGGPSAPGTGSGAPGGGTGGTGGVVPGLSSGVAPGLSGILGVDFAAPAFLAKPRLRPTRFRAARRGPAFIAARTGTTITYKLNEPARVSFTVQQNRHLSRVCRRKLARTSRHRTGTRCRRWISVKGRFSKASLAGASSVRFRGRLRGKALKPGRYRMVIRATDPAGNVTRPRRPVFRIVR